MPPLSTDKVAVMVELEPVDDDRHHFLSGSDCIWMCMPCARSSIWFQAWADLIDPLADDTVGIKETRCYLRRG